MAQFTTGKAAADMLRKIQEDYLKMGEPVTEERLIGLSEAIQQQSLLSLAEAVETDAGRVAPAVETQLEIQVEEVLLPLPKRRPKRRRPE